MERVKVLLVLMLIFTPAECILASHIEKKELRVLTWEGYAPQYKVSEFEQFIQQKYLVDLNVKVDYVSSSDQFFDYVRAGMYEVIAPSHNLLHDSRYKLIENELLIPIDIENVGNYKYVLSDLKSLEYAKYKNKVYSIPFAYGPYGLAYNASEIGVEPKSWNIFWDPKYSGKYTISSDYYEVNVYITALAMGIGKEDVHKISYLDNPEFRDKLNYLVRNASDFWVGVDTVDDLKGKQLATSWGFSFSGLKERGLNWKMATPTEGTTIWIDGHSLTYNLKKDITRSPARRHDPASRHVAGRPVGRAGARPGPGH